LSVEIEQEGSGRVIMPDPPSTERVSNPYESSRSLAEYLLFHYGSAEEILGQHSGPREALDFPMRCVRELVDFARVPAGARALEVGCAVGRSSFELGRFCAQVVGIDFSHAFIQAACMLKASGMISFEVVVEGDMCRPAQALVPAELDRRHVHFEVGDAMNLRKDLKGFDLVLAANLICRLTEPVLFLQRLPHLINPGGQLLTTTPFTWLEEFTPRPKWLGGRREEGLRSFDALTKSLRPDFELQLARDLPFLIREHERKFQYGVALGCRWIRR
jgi:putative 4-mercaptohistidine N1-methyltranferase